MSGMTKIRYDALPAAYARILSALERQSGLTREEIAEKAHVAATTLSGGGYLRHMKELGLIYISGWRRNACGAFAIAQYSAGSGRDYPRPKVSEENRAAPGMLRVLEVIDRYGPLDYRQAAKLAGLSVNTLKNAGYLDALVAQGKIYISAWRRGRHGPPRPLYETGRKQSADKPERYTPATKSRAYRSRAVARDSSLSGQIRRMKTSA